MKYLFCFTLILFCFQYTEAQLVYINDGTDIYTLNVETCELEFVVEADNNTSFYDISFHPNGNFYGVTQDGELYEVDLNTGGVSFVTDLPDGQDYNSLTSDGEGVFYFVGTMGDLWSYDLDNDEAVFLGDIGFEASGDLSFYEGNLYAAVDGDNIVLVDIDNPSNSSIIINESVSGNIFGIFSFAESCSEINTYANSSNGDIYLIDYENQSFEFICNVNVSIFGGASTSEFFGSSEPIVLDDLGFSNPICNEDNGEIVITATNAGNVLEYAINGGDYQNSNTFSDLEAGIYEVAINNEEGCTIFEEVELLPSNIPMIDDVPIVNPDCGLGSFSVTIIASGGTGNLEYSIDGLNFMPINEFPNLMEGAYTAFVMDENDCEFTFDFNLQAETPPSINALEPLATSCGENNGALVNIVVAGGEMPYEYSIDNGETYQLSTSFENLESGDYTLLIKDGNACQDSQNFNIMESLALEVIPEIRQTSCNEDNGEIILNVENANGVLEYSKDGGIFQTSNVFSDLMANNYTIEVNDTSCSEEITVDVLESESPSLEIGETQNATCNANDAFIQLIASGGEGPYQYSLDGINFQSDALFENLPAEIYEFTIKDANDCTNNLSDITINSDPCTVVIPTAFSPNNDGHNDDFRLISIGEDGVTVKSYRIYNRWGGLVHEAQDFPINSNASWWDGTHNNKANLIGVYLYFIEVELSDNSSTIFKGNVTLIR